MKKLHCKLFISLLLLLGLCCALPTQSRAQAITSDAILAKLPGLTLEKALAAKSIINKAGAENLNTLRGLVKNMSPEQLEILALLPNLTPAEQQVLEKALSGGKLNITDALALSPATQAVLSKYYSNIAALKALIPNLTPEEQAALDAVVNNAGAEGLAFIQENKNLSATTWQNLLNLNSQEWATLQQAGSSGGDYNYSMPSYQRPSYGNSYRSDRTDIRDSMVDAILKNGSSTTVIYERNLPQPDVYDIINLRPGFGKETIVSAADDAPWIINNRPKGPSDLGSSLTGLDRDLDQWKNLVNTSGNITAKASGGLYDINNVMVGSFSFMLDVKGHKLSGLHMNGSEATGYTGFSITDGSGQIDSVGRFNVYNITGTVSHGGTTGNINAQNSSITGDVRNHNNITGANNKVTGSYNLTDGYNTASGSLDGKAAPLKR